jgi:hypothetical protein
MSLFQFWNLNRFENPFPVNREEVMKLCKIGSLNTYHKCLHDLDRWGYIKYEPSFNPMTPSLITILDLDDMNSPHDENKDPFSDSTRRKNDTADDTTLDAKSIQLEYNPRRKNDTADDTGLASLIKQYKQYKQINEREENSQAQNSKDEKMKPNRKSTYWKDKRKKVAKKKEKAIPPTIDQVTSFFRDEKYPELEAQKFFNHFQSNGWKVGGKSPMKDWQAAARNWMLNSHNFGTQNKAKPGSTNLNKNKKYDIPL